MFNKVIFIGKEGKVKIGYRICDIEVINNGKLKDFWSKDDIVGNWTINFI